MRLSKRLKEICDMVPSCDTLTDIGTDHAFVPITTVSRGKAKRGRACDIEKGPLERAKANVKKEGLAGRIECLLSDGLSSVDVSCDDVIVITGMGGENIRDIIDASLQKAENAKALVLGPQRHPERLLSFLLENGFEIDEERELIDREKNYILIRTHFGGLK